MISPPTRPDEKAVEAGGVHPLYIDDLSTKFAVLINEVSSLSDVNALSSEMIHKYCLLVKNHAMKGYSAVTKEIISSALPITAIATVCGYNDINYFIRVFKRTYGLSPKQYQKSIMFSAH